MTRKHNVSNKNIYNWTFKKLIQLDFPCDFMYNLVVSSKGLNLCCENLNNKLQMANIGNNLKDTDGPTFLLLNQSSYDTNMPVVGLVSWLKTINIEAYDILNF